MKKKFALCFVFAAMFSAVGCNESVDWSVCAEHKSSSICLDGQAVTCDSDGKVEETKSCEGTDVCKDGACVAFVCTNNEVKCESNNVYVCSDNSWNLKTECGSDKTCNESTGVCDASSSCEEGEQKCEETNGKAVVSKCVNGEWQAADVDCTDKACDSETNTCVDKVCSYTNSANETVKLADGEKICDGVKIVSCEYPSTTISGCEAGVCVDNGEITCEVRSCEVAEAGVTLEHEETTCLNGKLVKCNDGMTEETECAEGKVCRNGETTCDDGKACGDVAHLAVVCDENNDVVKCVDGELTVTDDCDPDNADEDSRTYCSSALICEPAGADDCVATETTPLVKDGENWCDGKVLRACSDKVLSEGSECSGDTPVCDKNACRAYNTCSLEDGTTVEHTAAVCIADPVSTGTCNDGKLVADESGACAAHQICSVNESGAACVCDEANHWVSGTEACVCADGFGGANCDCDLSANYVDDSGKCTVRCTASDNRCENTATGLTLYTCDESTGVLSTTNETLSCKSATEVGDCLNDATKCDDSGVSTCADGVWGTATACAAGCDAENKACAEGECTESNYTTTCADKSAQHMTLTGCTSNKCVYTCSTGFDGENCDCDLSTSYIDDSGKCVERCTASDNRCENTATGSKLYTCNESTGVLSSKDETFSCKSATEVGDCLNDATKCDDSGVSTCADGVWGTATACVAGCDADGKACAEGECTESNYETVCVDKSAQHMTLTGCTSNKCVYTCSDGYDGENCDCDLSTSYIDESGNCVLRCAASDNSCVDTTTGSTVNTCNESTGVLSSKDETVSCKNETEAGECLNGATQCDFDENLYTCEAGVWNLTMNCVEGCNSDQTACVKPK